MASWGPASASDPPTLATALEPVTPTSSKGTLHHGCPGLWDLGGGPFTQSPSTGVQSESWPRERWCAAWVRGGPRGSMKNVVCTYDVFYLLGTCVGARGQKAGPGTPRGAAWWPLPGGPQHRGLPAVGLCEQLLGAGQRADGGRESPQHAGPGRPCREGPVGGGMAPSGQTAHVFTRRLK